VNSGTSWLAWLDNNGLLDAALPPGDRLTPERLRLYLAAQPARAPYTQVCWLQELYDAMRVLSPETDWTWFKRVLARAAAAAHPVIDRRSRLRSAFEIVRLGQDLMADAEASLDMNSKDRAVLYRDGLMISLLIAKPLRVSTFAAIRIGQHLVQHGANYWLLFEPSEIKSRRPYEDMIPDDLVLALERYISIYRPILLQRHDETGPRESQALWICKRGTALAKRSIANPICKRTRQAFGKSLPPHWFRHAAATTLAIEAPANVRDAQYVLDHGSFGVTERYYRQAQSLVASRRLTAVMSGLKNSLRTRPSAGEPV
jgi:integrase/recombinase XerD